jgi:hypothetical protein
MRDGAKLSSRLRKAPPTAGRSFLSHGEQAIIAVEAIKFDFRKSKTLSRNQKLEIKKRLYGQ